MREEAVEDIVRGVLTSSFPWFTGEVDGCHCDIHGSWQVALIVEGDRRIALIPEENLDDNNRPAIAAILNKIVGGPPQERRIGFRAH